MITFYKLISLSLTVSIRDSIAVFKKVSFQDSDCKVDEVQLLSINDVDS